MNNIRLEMLREAGESLKDCSFSLEDAGRELQRVMDILVDIAKMEKEEYL